MVEWEGGNDVCNDTQLMKFCIVLVLMLYADYSVFMFPAHDVVQVCQKHVVHLHKAYEQCNCKCKYTTTHVAHSQQTLPKKRLEAGCVGKQFWKSRHAL
jgi:hypothetical protein